MKLAVVDLGTNTCRLLLAEVDGGAITRRNVRDTHVVRLGQGVDRTRRLDGEAATRTRRRLADYAARIDAYGPERRLLVATSVLRDAVDGVAFLAAAERDLGLPYRIVAGEEEGRLAFRGATAWLDRASTAPPDLSAAEVAVVDIGGGSTEFAVGRPGRPPRFVRSLDMGVVRITERFFADDPPTDAQWRAAGEFVDGLLQAGLPAAVRAGAGALVGVAGTCTTLVAHELGLRVYDPALVHGHLLTLAQISAAIGLFRTLTSAERGRLAGIQKGREDVILAGALIAQAACRAFGVEAAVVSEDDILEGIALWLADGLPPLAPPLASPLT
jgi:exopolyphosphatase/guanosine-5'-triphosphate,3'-diphosphate pyrophosphatase